MEQTVQDAPDQQVSLTDPDARSMATSGKGTATVGYNVQIAVDAEHHLIVAHEVINQGYDRHQLAPMAFKAQQATGCEQITALADRGYFNGDQVLSCEGTGVAPVVPKTLTSGSTKRGLFTGQDFIYDAENDHYTCPAGQNSPNPSAGGSHGRLRPLPPPERLLHLSAQTPVHADPAADLSAGRMRTCSTGCRTGSTACPRPWACDDRPSNTRSGPSRLGWAPPTS